MSLGVPPAMSHWVLQERGRMLALPTVVHYYLIGSFQYHSMQMHRWSNGIKIYLHNPIAIHCASTPVPAAKFVPAHPSAGLSVPDSRHVWIVHDRLSGGGVSVPARRVHCPDLPEGVFAVPVVSLQPERTKLPGVPTICRAVAGRYSVQVRCRD